jgi:tubulin-folding cofactor B
MFCCMQTTIEAVKERLRDRCGTAVESMYLQLYDDEGNKICDLNEDFRPLGYYSPFDGYAYLAVMCLPYSCRA